ncbi:MFS transporter [Acetobacter thailandicus]|uniref:MFS transporter n=2 Tax=Acetobacteraceae TaxID=433 RepID=A0ABT3QCY7_9PROT|nr:MULTISPECIES: MFS transporter [Acetobacter]MBS0960389.1 MFS transporter [Acetobacter thailandicus]MBS0979589.1 MFS transporter [Acetobacter thailandicus]MBS0986257.1 MFS transporter [Acetobacter thailandicus]MBS1003327.1 MFS transporter [Acetobacter thailandicus]MCX2563162.1 MFS transporter [Acetobacter thailandicus]
MQNTAVYEQEACSDQKQDRLYAKMAQRILPLLFLGFLASYLDRVNVGYAKLRMLSDLGMSEAAYGLGIGLFFLGYILCEVPSNLFLVKFGARNWIARILITWGLCSGAMMFVHTPTQFYVLRVLLGIAEAGFMPGVLYYLAVWFPPHYRSKVTAVFMAGIPLASVIGGPLSGWLMQSLNGVGGYEGWRWLFFWEAAPPVVIGIAVFLMLPASPEKASWLNKQDVDTLYAANPAILEKVSMTSSIVAAFRNPWVWLLGVVDGTLLLGLYTIAFWTPSLLHDEGIRSTLEIGCLSAIPQIGAVISMFVIGRSSDKHGERRWHIVLPILFGSLSMACIPFCAGNIAMTIACITVANMGILGALPPFWVLPSLMLKGNSAAVGLALAGSVANIAGFFATALVGYARSMTGGMAGVIWLFAAMVFLGSISVLLIPKEKMK